MTEEIINRIEQQSILTFDESFNYAQYCSSLLNDSNFEKEGRKIIINILNNWNKIHSSTIELWTDLIEAAGFYPYLDKYKNQLHFSNLPAQIRKEMHISDHTFKYYHDEQYELSKILNSGKNLIVSAPTSFGKSLLIEEVIASMKFKNIVIIQPTLALLDETRKKLIKYTDSYKLIVRTSQDYSIERGNIFLFTAERVNEYGVFPTIDFLVIDEFYKLSGKRDDERSSSLNNAFHFLLKTFNPKFYLLGPNIDGISDGFEKEYDAVFYKSQYSLVDSREVNIFKEHEGKFGTSNEKKKYKEKVLFELLSTIKEQSIIYCSSPNKVRQLSKKFTEYLIENNFTPPNNNFTIIEWIKENISKDWGIIQNLIYGIGIHDGALQKHITSSIIDYFNSGQINYLFCTSTIIEGVNTSAKNIIYFDEFKGLKPNGRPKEIDFFDYSNIKGRAGRMMEHFVGKIYNFNKPPANENIIVDIPFFQQNPIKDEVLIQLSSDEILYPHSEQVLAINKIPEIEKTIIKKNGVKVHGQKSIFNTLRSEINDNYSLIKWNSPTYIQLTYVINLAWDNLILEGESTKPMTKAKLVNLVFNYGIKKNIRLLVQSNYDYKKTIMTNISDSDIRDLAIQETFQIMKHWFEYKVPKWLSVINEIQKFICQEKGLAPGNYIHYANLIENDFIRENLAILSEYGIPNSAIRKIEYKIPSQLNQDEVLNYIKAKGIHLTKELLEYERKKITDNFR